ncbi:M61 family metallopeptidase [Marinicellulosiphila megalodicopiae]|uniref:M61 family metallopeptidase n=1 Tax=Marinicellulosiphila megalodicopiae TaxID=2724896 RepID=UPI003BAEF0A3
MSVESLHYQIKVKDTHAHLFEVSLTFTPISDTTVLSLPSWIPGSYLIRDFAKNIIQIQITDSNQSAVPLIQLDKNHWQFESTQTVTVCYQVYAFDLSVRSAYLDQNQGFFNGTSVFLCPQGLEHYCCELNVIENPHTPTWKVATSLKTEHLYQFGLYQAQNYDEFIDHPFILGDFDLHSFYVGDVQHDVVLMGKHYCDMARLCDDLQAICQTQIGFFNDDAPFTNKRYVFMTLVTQSGYGGLEHRDSTVLMCPRNDLPRIGEDKQTISDEYLNYLTLCSHEYFHNWNVKRIKPKAFAPYQLDKESYTTQLWAFEGFTSYYEALMVARAGLIDSQRFIKYLAQTLTRVFRTQGRFSQSLSDSSFNAWTKFYQQDANANNAIVSYYTKGAYIALALDLILRENQSSLDALMQLLWDKYKDGSGVPEGEIELLAGQLAGIDLTNFFDQALNGTQDIDLFPLLAQMGVKFGLGNVSSLSKLGGHKANLDGNEKAFIGARLAPHPWGAKVVFVENNGAAYKAGLASGDIIIALDNLKVSDKTIEKELSKFPLGTKVSIHAFRDSELFEMQLPTITSTNHTVWLDVLNQDLLDKWVLTSN